MSLFAVLHCTPVLTLVGQGKQQGETDTLLLLLGLGAQKSQAPFASSARLEIVSKINYPFVTPYAIAVDAADNVYVSDGCFLRESNGGTLYTADTFGVYLGGNYSAYPNCGIPQYRILKFDALGNYSGWIGKGLDGASGLHSAGGSQQAVRTSSNWPVTPVSSWKAGELNRVRSLAVDTDGTLYALEANRIHRYTGPSNDFAGTLGWACDSACQTLIDDMVVQYHTMINTYDTCIAGLAEIDDAGYQACYDLYYPEAVLYSQKYAAVIASVGTQGGGGWHTDPGTLVLDFPPNANQIGPTHGPEYASGIAINGNQLWIGSYCWCTIGGEIRVFDKQTTLLEGWFGRSRYIVNNVMVAQYYGYRPVSDYASGIKPVHAAFHSESPGALNAPRAVAWHEGLLYIADNTSNPVLSVSQMDGSIVKSRSHASGDKPFGMTVNADGYVLTSNMYNGTIEILDPHLNQIGLLQVETPSTPNVWYPVAAANFAWDSQGYVYFTSTTKNEVIKARLVLQ